MIEKFPATLALAGLPLDLALSIFLIAAIFIYGVTIGRRFVLAWVLGVYFSYAIVRALPNLAKPPFEAQINLPSLTHAALFVILSLGLGWLLSGTTLGAFFHFAQRGLGLWWQVFVLSILSVGFFASGVLVLLPEETLELISPLTLKIFFNDPAPVLWALAPVLFLLILRHSLEKE